MTEKIGENFRLQKIEDIERLLENERDNREILSNKYSRSVKVLHGAEIIFTTLTIGLSAVSVVLLSTIIAAPAVIAIESSVIGAGLLIVLIKYYSRRLHIKAEKHDKIKILAVEKLSSTGRYISKGLDDDHLSDEEFDIIQSEFDKFCEMKQSIRVKAKDEETNISFTDKLREFISKRTKK